MNELELLKKQILSLEGQLRTEHQVEEILTEMDEIDSLSDLFLFLFERIPKFFTEISFRYHFIHIDKPYRREEDIRNLSHIFRASVKEFFSPNAPHADIIKNLPVVIHPAGSVDFEEGKNYLPVVLENAIIGAKDKENSSALLGYIEFLSENDPSETLAYRARIIRKIIRAVRTHLERIRSYILLEEHSLLAYQDYLTEIYNRRWFFRRCKHVRQDLWLAKWGVIVLDLDFFKKINDTYGHADGDKALVFAARTLRNILQDEKDAGLFSIFGRVGGEEFAIYLHDITCDGVMAIGEKLRKALESSPWTIKNNTKLYLTGSFWTYCSTDDETVESGLAKADIALYDAKKWGRNRVELFRPESLNLTQDEWFIAPVVVRSWDTKK